MGRREINDKGGVEEEIKRKGVTKRGKWGENRRNRKLRGKGEVTKKREEARRKR